MLNHRIDGQSAHGTVVVTSLEDASARQATSNVTSFAVHDRGRSFVAQTYQAAIFPVVRMMDGPRSTAVPGGPAIGRLPSFC